ncbi:MAG: RHS repeat protein [Vicinamibacterales bacterium]
MTARTFDAVGNTVTIARPNGVTTRMTYDVRDRVVGITDLDATAAVLESEVYTLDGLGNQLASTVTTVRMSTTGTMPWAASSTSGG